MVKICLFPKSLEGSARPSGVDLVPQACPSFASCPVARARRSLDARRPLAILSFFLCFLLLGAGPARAETPDTLTLADGENLVGKLVKVLAGAVTFHSNILGDVTVPMDKVKELHAGQFAVVTKGQQVTKKTAAAKVPVGAITIENDAVHVSGPQAPEQTLAAKDVNFLIDAASFRRELDGRRSFFYGWNGPVTLGASLVKSTNSAQTYTGAVALVRAVPATAWLPPSTKLLLNLSGSYGLAKDPQIVVDGNVVQTASVTKTDILHGGLEYDKYWSPAIFGFVNANADHNFGSGLQLQEAFGGGIGWTVLNNARNELDLKAAMEYERQEFYNGAASPNGTPSLNLASAAIYEFWKHALAHGMNFNEFVTLSPAFNEAQAYSAVAGATLLFPVYKGFNFSVSSSDNYIGDPPTGYQRNSFQFTAGVSYLVK